MNVTGPIAAIIIATIVCVFSAATVLVVKGFIPVDYAISTLTHGLMLLFGALIPITYRRTKGGGVSFHIDSDPPKE